MSNGGCGFSNLTGWGSPAISVGEWKEGGGREE